MSKRKKEEKGSVDIEDVAIEEPTVEIDESPCLNDSLLCALNPIPYKTKGRLLADYTLFLKNAPVAYYDNMPFQIDECIDYFYYMDEGPDMFIRKATASASASERSCVILSDTENNLFLCSLVPNIWFPDVYTFDEFSGPYGGLTYLETRGKRYVGNLRINLIVTSEGIILVPRENINDFIPRNANYYLSRERQAIDFVKFFIYIAKGSLLDKRVTGVYYRK